MHPWPEQGASRHCCVQGDKIAPVRSRNSGVLHPWDPWLGHVVHPNDAFRDDVARIGGGRHAGLSPAALGSLPHERPVTALLGHSAFAVGVALPAP